MFRISSEKELLGCFRLLDREEVLIPETFKYPLGVKDYLTWIEPTGTRVYLIFNDRKSESPLGIVFRQTQSGGGTHAQMCEWCHSVRGGDGVSLLSANATKNRRVGLSLCRNLSCREKLETTPGVNDIPLGTSSEDRLHAIMRKMTEFARRELF